MNVCFIVQLIVHIPFIYYIGKEQMLIMHDENFNCNMTNMVDRVRTEQGDPRYFLAELCTNTDENILQGEAPNVVYLHRLPHMKLSCKTLYSYNVLLFSFVVLGAFSM